MIKSHARLTYPQVVDILAAKDNSPQWLVDCLVAATNLHQELAKLKRARGALEFCFQETKLVHDDDGNITNIVPDQRLMSHEMIENFMLCANSVVAEVLTKNEVPALFRVHLEPNPAKLEVLQDFIGQLGLKAKLSGSGASLARQLQGLLDQARVVKNFDQLQLMLLKSMSQANYQAQDLGHFGLAYSSYTHFTSPIRRYSDLIVHRAIVARVIDGDQAAKLADKQELAAIGEHCSLAERRADLATREVLDKLKCRFMQGKLGQAFVGEVVGVTGFGLFLRLQGVYVEGLLHITDLPQDYYHFDDIALQLSGRKNKRVFGIGSVLKVKVAKVDVELGRIDFAMDAD